MKKNMFDSFTWLRNRHFVIIDFLIFLISPTIALMLRLDDIILIPSFFSSLLATTVIFMAVKFVLCYVMGMYRHLWQHAGIDELRLIIILTVMIGISNAIVYYLLFGISSLPPLPRSIPYIDMLVTASLLALVRMIIRLSMRAQGKLNGNQCKRTLIIGAGQAGISLLDDMQKSPELGYKPVGLIDDDPKKKGQRVRGVSVIGNRSQIKNVVNSLSIQRIIIAIPSASGEEIRQIIDQCKEANVEIKTIPSLAEIISGEVNTHSIREMNIDDLLRREPIKTDIKKVAEFLEGKKVLVTGAGGSIGSEICRQILKFNPIEIVLLGHGENSVFHIKNELQKSINNNNLNIKLSSVIADFRSKTRIKFIVDNYLPDVIFHAGAHKHVTLMEENQIEAITNNILGTRNLLDCANSAGVNTFVMISTDKAVNPASIMGASKRVAEMMVIKKAREYSKSYVCVRFGNVLGSRGSVIPVFKQQIENGGPIVVTHPDVRRFFITIPEAVQLVLQASTIGEGGEIFILDMGKPIKILDMAKDMIQLSGLSETDIKIKFSGLRRGEKLFEELFIEGEEWEVSNYNNIFKVTNASNFIPHNLDKYIDSFEKLALSHDVIKLVKSLKDVVQFTTN